MESPRVELLAEILLDLGRLAIRVRILTLPPGRVAGVTNREVGNPFRELVLMTQGQRVGKVGLQLPQKRTSHGSFSHKFPRSCQDSHPRGSGSVSLNFGY